MNPIRILIADDHPLLRDGLRFLLSSVEDAEVVGEATTGEEAVTLALTLQPDVILMDIQMPASGQAPSGIQAPLDGETAPINGIEATRRIVDSNPNISILMLTMYEDDEAVFAAMQAGARGYLVKGAGQEEILRAIHAAAQGEAIFSPSIAARLLGYFRRLQNGDYPSAPVFPELTDRERQILDLIAQGLNNNEIASNLSLSPKTVRNNVSNIFSKLQVADRAQAIVRAREAGLGHNKP